MVELSKQTYSFLYTHYLHGCEKLEWIPLPEGEFRYLFSIYREYHDPSYGTDSRLVAWYRFLLYRFSPSRLKQRRTIIAKLHFLETAIMEGLKASRNGGDGDTSTGIPVAPVPPPPVRTGRSAQAIIRPIPVTVFHGGVE